MEINRIYHGNALFLLDAMDISCQLIIIHPPNLSETNFTEQQYIRFLQTVHIKCSQKLTENGILVSLIANRKSSSGISTKNIDVINCLSGNLNLFDYKIWTKAIKSSQFSYRHMLFFCKGNIPEFENEVSDFDQDIWPITPETKSDLPYEVIHRLVCKLTQKNDLVLDPFARNGKMARVAMKNNRNFLGFEIDPEGVKESNKLIKFTTFEIEKEQKEAAKKLKKDKKHGKHKTSNSNEKGLENAAGEGNSAGGSCSDVVLNETNSTPNTNGEAGFLN